MTGDPTDWLEHSLGVRRLDERAVISVTGDDAHEWLQGQLTNQLEGKKPGDSVYGFVLTLKGRVLVDAWVLFADEEIWLDVPKAQVPALLERLNRYIIMEDVDLAHRPDLTVLTAQGPAAAKVRPGGWASDRLGGGGRVWVVPTEQAEAETAWLTRDAEALGGGELSEDAWARAHVLQGRPRFGVDFGEDTYPQEPGLTSIAVSFIKGCYVGQETVMMLKSRGKAPKRLFRWQIEGPGPVDPGTPISLGDREVGTITSAVRVGNRIAALGYLKRGHEPEAAAEDEVDKTWTIGGVKARPVGPVEEGLGASELQGNATEGLE